jgi:hypothetical protein
MQQPALQAPVDWHMTSGTTGSSKHFPATALSTARAMTASGRSSWQLQLAKFPLPAPGGESSGSEVPTRHRNLSLALAGPCEELPGQALQWRVCVCVCVCVCVRV